MQFRNFSKGSVNPFGGLYKTLINVFQFFLHKSSIEIDSTCCSTVLLVNTKVWSRLKVYGIFYVNRNPTSFSIVSDLMNAFIIM